MSIAYGPRTTSDDFADSLRTERYYERPIDEVEADLDAEEAALADDLWAEEWAAEADAELRWEQARDERGGSW